MKYFLLLCLLCTGTMFGQCIENGGFESCDSTGYISNSSPGTACAWTPVGVSPWRPMIVSPNSTNPEYNSETGYRSCGDLIEGDNAMMVMAFGNGLIFRHGMVFQVISAMPSDTLRWSFYVTLADSSAWATNTVGIDFWAGSQRESVHQVREPLTEKDGWFRFAGTHIATAEIDQLYIGSVSYPVNPDTTYVGGPRQEAMYIFDKIAVSINGADCEFTVQVVHPQEPRTKPDRVIGLFDIQGRPVTMQHREIIFERYESGRVRKIVNLQ